MIRGLFCATLASILAACSSSPLVYDPRDLPGDRPSGSVTALGDLVPRDGRAIRLVFVHGVGDHCRGYALDRNSGWLNDDSAAAIGMQPVTDLSERRFINVNVFMGGVPDARSGVEYSKRMFRLHLPGILKEVRVEAIEITWSPLTQWLKSNQLGYDSPSTTPAANSQSSGCVQPPDADIPLTKEPPARLLLDRSIKEQVFDRNLADAILYSGTYSATMERGVAEALCQAVTASPAGERCEWPARPSDLESYKYFFVTHSLGSRIIYDVFLNLLGYRTDAKANPFNDEEVKRAQPYLSGMLADTRAFYMMANQLALLGLANVPKDARSGTGIHPFFDIRGVTTMGTLPDSAKDSSNSAPGSVFGNVLGPLAFARNRALQDRSLSNPKLQIVAFNDTNDLLTWHIPPWYTNAGALVPDGRPEIDVANVFVQNAAKLLIIESPAAAHGNYFTKRLVWDVIACGAKNGAVLFCMSATD